MFDTIASIAHVWSDGFLKLKFRPEMQDSLEKLFSSSSLRCRFLMLEATGGAPSMHFADYPILYAPPFVGFDGLDLWLDRSDSLIDFLFSIPVDRQEKLKITITLENALFEENGGQRFWALFNAIVVVSLLYLLYTFCFKSVIFSAFWQRQVRLLFGC